MNRGIVLPNLIAFLHNEIVEREQFVIALNESERRYRLLSKKELNE